MYYDYDYVCYWTPFNPVSDSFLSIYIYIYIYISRLIKQFKMNIFASLLSNSILNTQIQYLTYYVNSIVNPFPLGKQQFSRKSLENANFWFAEGGMICSNFLGTNLGDVFQAILTKSKKFFSVNLFSSVLIPNILCC